MFRKSPDAKMDDVQMVSLWIFSVLFNDVWKYNLPDVAGWKRCPVIKRSREAFLDISGTVVLGLYGGNSSGLGCPVQLWILQSDADLTVDRSDRNGSL